MSRNTLFLVQHVENQQIKSVIVAYRGRVILWTDAHVKNVLRSFAEVHVGTTHHISVDNLDLLVSAEDRAEFGNLPDNFEASRRVARCIEALVTNLN